MPSTRITGLGGYVDVYDESGFYYGRLDNEMWEIDLDTIIDEATDSSSTGWADGEPVILKVNSITITAIDKTDVYPELLGMGNGARLSLIMKHGNSGRQDEVNNTIVRNLRKTNPQTQLRRITVTCEYGQYLGNT